MERPGHFENGADRLFGAAGAAAQPAPVYLEVWVPLPLRRTFTYRLSPAAGEPVERGAVVRVPFGRRQLVGVVERRVGPPDRGGVKDVQEVLPAPYRIPDELLQLADWIAGYYAATQGEARTLLLPPRPATAARSNPMATASTGPDPPPELNEAQRTAVASLHSALTESRYRSFLLHGVTGSGKTEVYLRVIERTLAAGRGALVLLPEIALTPQTLRRLRARFPGQVAPYHSRLSHGERCAVWEAAARGEVPLVVGARSAAFVPVRNLGLIVVDEEHEPSYKADNRPRYHARDVALMRASIQDVPIVLGSATPSLESYQNVRLGKHRLLQLPHRIGGPALPTVEIVDRRGSTAAYEALSSRLAEAVETCLDRDEQAIIFHNRRGFARYVQCRACGEAVHCPNCDISLVYHLHGDRLHCHYCGHRRRVPEACGSCGATTLRTRGTGTQRVEVALRARFPRARILRLDQDTTGRKSAHREILDAFRRGEADILLGTQMVAKGLHFPRVTVVGVVDADAGLHFPDFRAHERSFQLLTQVAGRSGRAGPGSVILQTFDPEHRVLQRVRTHDVLGFLDEELAHRAGLGYPPHRRLAAVTVTAPTEPLLEAALERLGGALRTGLTPHGIEVLGPARAVLGRVNRRYRGQLLLKGGLSVAGKTAVLDVFQRIAEEVRGGRRLEMNLDVDPLQLL